jgi:hypothetical protein
VPPPLVTLDTGSAAADPYPGAAADDHHPGAAVLSGGRDCGCDDDEQEKEDGERHAAGCQHRRARPIDSVVSRGRLGSSSSSIWCETFVYLELGPFGSSYTVCLVGRVHGCMTYQMQKQNESRVWLTEFLFGPGHVCANSRSRPGPPDTADLCVPGEPGCARHSRRAVTR